MSVSLNGTTTLSGGKVIEGRERKAVASCCVTGGDCRGGQCGLAPQFVPPARKVEFVGSDGKVAVKDVL